MESLSKFAREPISNFLHADLSIHRDFPNYEAALDYTRYPQLLDLFVVE